MSKNKRLWLKLAMALVGAAGGLVYWKYNGVDASADSIRSVWYFSVLWGLVMGYIIGGIIGYFLWRRAAENE